MSAHPLHRVSLTVFACLSVVYFFLNLIVYQPNEIESVSVHCVERFSHREDSPDSRLKQHDQLQISLSSWDISHLPSNQLDIVINYLNSIIEDTTLPHVIQLQGVQPWMRSRFKSLLFDHGGCWAYAPLWTTPRWLRHMHIYRSLFGPLKSQETVDQGLWTGVIGMTRLLEINAQRWSLPPRPGRWPERLLYRQPAALSLNIGWLYNDLEKHIKRTEYTQVINIRLPDTTQKHQAGALALQKLTRMPLAQQFKEPWIILGDWRVTPPQTPAHQMVQYRFQRFSLEVLEQKFVALFRKGTDPEQWGRWRMAQSEEAAVIDHAYASQGVFELNPSFNHFLPWLGDKEQRAPLFVKWIVGKP